MSHLLFDIKDHIATLTFNQPDKRNAYSPEMAVKLTQYLRECDKNPEVRVVIITGAGNAFCVGLDLNDVRERGEQGQDDQTPRPPDSTSAAYLSLSDLQAGYLRYQWRRRRFGAAYPLTCDIRLAASEANIAFPS